MIKPYIIFSAIFSLIYLCIQIHKYNFLLLIQEDNILSIYFSFLLKPFIFYIITIIFIITMLSSLSSKTRFTRWFGYVLALVIINFSMLLVKDLLSYNNYTNCLLFSIYHPIPVEAKIFFLDIQLETIRQNLNITLDGCAKHFITNNITSANFHENLHFMNCEAITKYAKDLILNAITISNDKIIEEVNRSPLDIDFKSLGLMGITIGACIHLYNLLCQIPYY